MDSLLPALVLGLVDPGGCQGWDAHAITDEDHHIFSLEPRFVKLFIVITETKLERLSLSFFRLWSQPLK